MASKRKDSTTAPKEAARKPKGVVVPGLVAPQDGKPSRYTVQQAFAHEDVWYTRENQGAIESQVTDAATIEYLLKKGMIVDNGRQTRTIAELRAAGSDGGTAPLVDPDTEFRSVPGIADTDSE